MNEKQIRLINMQIIFRNQRAAERNARLLPGQEPEAMEELEQSCAVPDPYTAYADLLKPAA